MTDNVVSVNATDERDNTDDDYAVYNLINNIPVDDFDYNEDDEEDVGEEGFFEGEASWIVEEPVKQDLVKQDLVQQETWIESIFGSIGDVSEEEMLPDEKSEETVTIVEVPSRKSFDEEVRESVEPDYVLAEIPVEVLADREATIDMLRGLITEMKPLKRRNKHLEVRVHYHMKKTQRKAGPVETGKTNEEIDKTYGRALATYKTRIDQSIAQEMQLLVQIGNYKDKLSDMQKEDERIFEELLRREREIAVGLVYVKTGGKITEKVADVMTNRQKGRRRVLARDRFHFILLQHRLERINALLKSFEVLGEGMTTLDYEALRVANVNYLDKLDERERDLEKLRTTFAVMANALAHLKEKEVCIMEDMEYERDSLTRRREETTKVRTRLNHLLLLLRDIRVEYGHRRIDAGMLVTQPVLLEMDKAMKMQETLINDIEVIKDEIEKYSIAIERRKRNASRVSSGSRSSF